MMIFEMSLTKKHLMKPETLLKIFSALVELFFDPTGTVDPPETTYHNLASARVIINEGKRIGGGDDQTPSTTCYIESLHFGSGLKRLL
jgi:hypothetical protein